MALGLRQLPNAISALRLLLVLPISVAILDGAWFTALTLFLVAGFSDAADGYLAKQFGWQTRLGAWLDPAADKLLVAAVFVSLAVRREIPGLLAAAAVGRDLIIVAGALAYRRFVGPLAVRPSPVSKLNTLCQLSFVLAILVRRTAGVLPPWSETAGGALVLVTIAVSGLDYVMRYAARARGRHGGAGA
ncbi:MAG: CDP-alcohol phosphatidyltransferase family protein [Gammaproteobacteria bacterium]|nr:CDP-alcohol phosphatidyltransferase family protein [Gammaproteobacteria bacterium]